MIIFTEGCVNLIKEKNKSVYVNRHKIAKRLGLFPYVCQS